MAKATTCKSAGRLIRPYDLTPQERVIIGLLCDGMTNRDLAHHLKISIETVKRHFNNIFDKTGCGNRLEVALFALKKGLASLDDRETAAQKTKRQQELKNAKIAAQREYRKRSIASEIEAAHREIERYVERSRLLIQKL